MKNSVIIIVEKTMQNYFSDENKLIEMLDKYDKISELMNYQEVLLDKKLFLNLQKQKLAMDNIVCKYKDFLKMKLTLSEMKDLMSSLSKDDLILFEVEQIKLNEQMTMLAREINKLLVMYNASMESLMVEIVLLKGQQSARVYSDVKSRVTSLCKLNDFECVLVEDKLKISGLNAKAVLSKVMGVYTVYDGKNAGGCQVFVYDNQFSDTSFREEDVEIVASRSSGAGGQHINTTDSSIKATHIPTGIVAVSQDERSQIQNRDKALDRLKLKVEEFYIQQAKKEIDKQRKEQLNTLKSGKNIYVFDYTKGVVSLGDKFLEIPKFVDGENI